MIYMILDYQLCSLLIVVYVIIDWMMMMTVAGRVEASSQSTSTNTAALLGNTFKEKTKMATLISFLLFFFN